MLTNGAYERTTLQLKNRYFSRDYKRNAVGALVAIFERTGITI